MNCAIFDSRQYGRNRAQRITLESIMSRESVRLVSSAGTGHTYITTKNNKLSKEKLEMRKYDPKVRKHVVYRESKMK
ncbi:MAG: large subunit ribosomal protein L33 [Kiritimatiellia bacterium]